MSTLETRVPVAGVVLLAMLAGMSCALAQDGGADRFLVDDFDNSAPGRLPAGWEWRSSDEDKTKPYVVAEEDGNRYLQVRDRGQSVILGKKIKVDIEKYPYVSFKWRVHRVPKGGDERHGETGDSAAAVYIIYRRAMGLIPVVVKYVWSSSLPVGTALQRSGVGRPWVIVAASGKVGLGEWQKHVFDVRAAFRQTFGGDPPRRIIGVAVLSDANATASRAYADYDDLYFLSRAAADSGIQRMVDAD